jgi:hypothetical protein
VFHGERKRHEIKVSILDKIKVIIDKLNELEPEEMNAYYATKLVYPMGYLRNLNNSLDKTFMEEHIPHNCKMVFVG